jgi:polyhydroxybutyrate depolymerase
VRVTRVDLTVGTRARWARVWLPAQTSGAPLVLDLHGSGFDPQRHVRVTRTDSWAARGAVVMAPCAALPLRFVESIPAGWAWAVPGTPLYGEGNLRADLADIDDLGFLTALVQEARTRWGIDASRVFALGYSGGSRLLSRWAGRTSPLTAACCVAGVRAPDADTTVPLLAIHGGADVVNPVRGSDDPRWREPVTEAVRRWAAALGCTQVTTAESPDAVEHRWVRPDGSSPVRYIEIPAAGHAWPGATDAEHEQVFGRSAGVDATQAAAAFFAEISALTASAS